MNRRLSGPLLTAGHPWVDDYFHIIHRESDGSARIYTAMKQVPAPSVLSCRWPPDPSVEYISMEPVDIIWSNAQLDLKKLTVGLMKATPFIDILGRCDSVEIGRSEVVISSSSSARLSLH